MLLLNGEQVRRALPMPAAIAAMKEAYAAQSQGRAVVPLRARLPIPSQEAVLLVMPAFVQDPGGDGLAVKIVSLFPGNRERGLSLIQAAVLVLDAGTGQALALLEGSSLTAIRTGAGAGAATDLLARHDSRVAAIFGAGVQARTQLAAICAVRPIERAWVYAPTAAHADRLVEEMAGAAPVPADLRRAESPRQAVAEADIICAATTSSTPVFDDAALKPGVHINGVGSYTPEMQELPAETLARALLTVDARQAALAEAGDLIQPIRAGLFGTGHIQAEIGELVTGRHPGRSSPGQITVFKSVGIAVQDVFAARLALAQARAAGLGQEVPW